MPRSLAAVVLLIALTPSAFGQGLLEQVREETRPRTDPASADRDKQSSPSGSGCSQDDGFSDLYRELFYAAVFSPFLIVKATFETIPDDATFPSHPYAGANVAYLQDLRRSGDAPYKPWGLRVGVEDGNNFDGLNRLGVRAWLDTYTRWGATTNWDLFHERLPCGCVDQLVLGDLLATYRFVQAERVQMHVGLGAQGLFDSDLARGGVKFLLSADLFPSRHLVLSAQAEAGNINDAFASRVRGTVGWQFYHGEAFVGYDWLRIGDVDLHGPMLGLRLWF